MTETATQLPISLNILVDSIREAVNSTLDETLRSKLGQFMSSSALSELMANLFESYAGEHEILDAGAGVGSLTAAFVQNATLNGAKSISSTCYEVSEVMTHNLIQVLELCKIRAMEFEINWQQKIIESDFIQASVEQLLIENYSPKYNKAILNPPYLKISAKGRERALLQKVGIEASNLYSAFVALAIKQLKSGGELVAITPRSFCNGPYFNDFRKQMLNECSLNKIHVFNSRKSAFKADNVLQENIIYHLTKGEAQRKIITVYSSKCANDVNPTIFEVPFDEIVKSNNPGLFIHIVTNEQERELANQAGGLPCSLSDLGIQVSTGKVVDFRTRENLSKEYIPNSVPLIFPQHLQNCSIVWPIIKAKKPNALIVNEATSSLMVPNGIYVLTRRLTAKEEKRRIVASIYYPEIANVDTVGFDNKINYFHAHGKPLDNRLAKGLWVFLNSTLIDKYFRQMNGQTQVNATDLRALRYPTREQLEDIANQVDFDEFEQEKIDEIINQSLQLMQHHLTR
ncbi:Eco57I restriction-modification methylase domain-containing protein [Providencia stuartii]|uniref:Eco57I restriction-modification methylase domain-containing protein n=1 Tax=Providencia stuartii TaxID=588 RepID=UPI0024B1FB35